MAGLEQDSLLAALDREVDFGMALLDGSGRLSNPNGLLCDQLGVSAERLQGTPWQQWVDGRDHEALRLIIASETPVDPPPVVNWLRPNGTRVRFRVTHHRLTQAAGRVRGWLILRDESTQSQLEREISMNQLILRIAGDGLHVLDRAGNLVAMSDSFCEALGYRREEMLGMNIAQWEAKWTAAELPAHLDGLFQAQHFTYETIFRRKNRQQIDVEIQVNAFALGDRPLLFCSSRDISLRKQSESLVRLQAGALNNSANGIAIADANLPDYPLIYVNPAFERITGYSSVDAIGRNSRFLQREDRDQPDLEVIRTALREGKPCKATLRNYRKDGTLFWNRFQIAPVADQEGTVTHFVAILNDVTERKRSDDYVRLVSQVFLYADESIYITDPQGLIIETNPAFTRTTGYGRDEVRGRSPSVLQSGRHEAGFFTEMWNTVLERGHWSGEVWNRRKNGEIYPDKLAVSVVRNDDGSTLSFVCVSSDISQLKAQQNRLEKIALHDSLTGLPNRVLLNDRLAMALADARRSRGKLALCFIDLDGFKPVNDTYGHDMGDHILVAVAQRMRSVLRATDTVARLGGDEFVLILTEQTQAPELVATLQRIMAALAQPYLIEDANIQLSASIGVTVFPDDQADADTLLRHADQAMYLAKESGRNRFHFFDVADERASVERNEGRLRLEQALAANELKLFYQPKVDLSGGEVIGMEALIRWYHPQRGWLLPQDFLPMAENFELENQLSEWVIRTALRQLEQWIQAGLDIDVSVNLPVRHLQAPGFPDFLRIALHDHPAIPHGRFELEILETAGLWDLPSVIETMEACRRLGVRFSIDDFGIGYASLDYLRRLPADTIKIDQSFIRDMLQDRDDLSLVEAVIELAEVFQKTVIAEGVESEDHGLMLIYMGCPRAQGFGIASPMPAAAVLSWCHDYRTPALWHRASRLYLERADLPLINREFAIRRWVGQVIRWADDTQAEGLTVQGGEPLDPVLVPIQGSYPGNPDFLALLAQRQERVDQVGSQVLTHLRAGRRPQAQDLIPDLAAARDQLIEHLHSVLRTAVI